MLRGSRRTLVTLGRLAAPLIVWLIIGAAWLGIYHGEHRHEQERAAAAEVQQRDITVEGCIRLPALKRPLCFNEPPRPEESESYAKYDLHAQQDMAEWALAMFIASLGALYVTAVGLYYVLRTFEQGREQFAAQNRAWLDVDVKFKDPITSNEKLIIVAMVTARNVGNTPATNVYFNTNDGVGLGSFSIVELDAFLGRIRQHREVVHRTGDTVFKGGKRKRSSNIEFTSAGGQFKGREFTIPIFVSYQSGIDLTRHVTPVIMRISFKDMSEAKRKKTGNVFGLEAMPDHHPMSIEPD